MNIANPKIRLQNRGLFGNGTNWSPRTESTNMVLDFTGIRPIPAFEDNIEFNSRLYDYACVSGSTEYTNKKIQGTITNSFVYAEETYYVVSDTDPAIGGLWTLTKDVATDKWVGNQIVSATFFPDALLKIEITLHAVFFLLPKKFLAVWRTWRLTNSVPKENPLSKLYASVPRVDLVEMTKDFNDEFCKYDPASSDLLDTSVTIENYTFKTLLEGIGEHEIWDMTYTGYHIVFMTKTRVFVGKQYGLSSAMPDNIDYIGYYTGLDFGSETVLIPSLRGGSMRFIASREGTLYIATDSQFTKKSYKRKVAAELFPYDKTRTGDSDVGGLQAEAVVNTKSWNYFLGRYSEGYIGLVQLSEFAKKPYAVKPAVDEVLSGTHKRFPVTVSFNGVEHVIFYVDDRVVIGSIPSSHTDNPKVRPELWSLATDIPINITDVTYTPENESLRYFNVDTQKYLKARPDKWDSTKTCSIDLIVERNSLSDVLRLNKINAYDSFNMTIKGIGVFPKGLVISWSTYSIDGWTKYSKISNLVHNEELVSLTGIIEVISSYLVVRVVFELDGGDKNLVEPFLIDDVYMEVKRV